MNFIEVAPGFKSKKHFFFTLTSFPPLVYKLTVYSIFLREGGLVCVDQHVQTSELFVQDKRDVFAHHAGLRFVVHLRTHRVR